MRSFFSRGLDWLADAARRVSAGRAHAASARSKGRAPDTARGTQWNPRHFDFEPTVRVGGRTRAPDFEKETQTQPVLREANSAERAAPAQTPRAPLRHPASPQAATEGAATQERQAAFPSDPSREPAAELAQKNESATVAQVAKRSANEARIATQNKALEWAEKRWGRLLDVLRFEPLNLPERWQAAQKEGLSEPERRLAPKNAKKFLDGLLIARRWEMLDALWSQLERTAFRAHLQSKAPSLARWAAGQIEESDLLPTKNPDLIDWARQKGAFEPDRLRPSHVADALSAGDVKRAREAIDDSGSRALRAPDAAQILAAMARKKELGGMPALGEGELSALWEVLGGAQGEGLASLAGLPPSELAWALAKLLDAMEETEAVELAILEQTAKINSKRAREIIGRVLAAQAASQERVGLLRGAIDRAPALMGVSRAQAMDSRTPAVVARVGGMRARAERGEGVSLSEAAALSGSKQAALALESMGAKAPDPKALKELTQSASKDIRRQVVRSQLAEDQAKAWRQTLTEWKSGVLGATTVTDLENRAREKFEQARKQKASPSRPPKA